jgi:hypothetical protein
MTKNIEETEVEEKREPTGLEVLNGGIEITAVKIDGSQEQVKVRQLPISLVSEWGNMQGDEAGLTDLLCGKRDRSLQWRQRNAHALELRLLDMLQRAEFEQLDKIEKRLAEARAEVASLEEKEHWSDSLTEESIIEIRELGDRLNSKRFGRWATRTRESTGRVMKEATSALKTTPAESP